MKSATHYREVLAEQACPGGGWGYAPGQPAHLEPTCLALLALAADRERFAQQVTAGLAWLRQCAVGDGTYRLARGREEAVWPTALVLFTQTVLDDTAADRRATLAALLGLRGRESPEAKRDEVNDIDQDLLGWPWAANNFAWVEPTAWACLALRRCGQGGHARVDEGLKLLLDRSLPGGGINYGNRRIFGISLDPIPAPTALMLLALQGKPGHPEVGRAIDYLSGPALAGDDGENLCWARLALDAHRDHPGVAEACDRLRERIESAAKARTELEWVRPAPVRAALAALALAVEEHHPFRLPAQEEKAAPVEPRPPLPRRRAFGERVRSALQGVALRAAAQLRPVEAMAAVHIAPVGDYNADLADVIGRQYENYRARVPLAGKRVVLKPNLVEYHRDKVINTHPHVVAAVIELCRREGAAEVVVAEGPGHWRNAEYLVAASGLGDVLRHYKVPFVDLNHDEPVKRLNLGRLTGLEHLYLAQTIATADVVISLPKLKTHHWAVATLSLKNLFGTLPGICYGWPKNELHWRGIDQSIIDIAMTRTPDLTIVDGIVGMEGDGPLNGTPKPMGILVMGTDLVAVDATCCRLMRLDADRVPYLVMGNRKKLGLLDEKRIAQLGETIAGRSQPFDTVPYFRPLWIGRPA